MPEPQAEVIVHEHVMSNEELVTKKYLKIALELFEKNLTIKFGAMLVATQLATIGIILTLLPVLLK